MVQDGALTNKVASGIYSPQTSQKVYVTQTIAGMRGVARPVQITILDRPPVPVATLNPYFYCENSAGGSANLAVSGKNVMWYKDADKKIMLDPVINYPSYYLSKIFMLPKTLVNAKACPLSWQSNHWLSIQR